jgi:hypothetical protein
MVYARCRANEGTPDLVACAGPFCDSPDVGELALTVATRSDAEAMSVTCYNCEGPPWPKMLRLASDGTPAYFYLCRDCGAIREDLHLRDGTLTGETYWHDIESASLPAAVVEQAREILDKPNYRQLSLFDRDG